MVRKSYWSWKTIILILQAKKFCMIFNSSSHPCPHATYSHTPTISRASGLLSKYIYRIWPLPTLSLQPPESRPPFVHLYCWNFDWSPYFCTCPHSIYSHIAAKMILLKFPIFCVIFLPKTLQWLFITFRLKMDFLKTDYKALWPFLLSCLFHSI